MIVVEMHINGGGGGHSITTVCPADKFDMGIFYSKSDRGVTHSSSSSEIFTGVDNLDKIHIVIRQATPDEVDEYCR